MRPVQMADLEAAARALCAVAADQRAALAQEICARADLADRYRKRLGAPHPVYGTGSVLSAAARLEQVPRPAYMTDRYLAAVAVMCSALRKDLPIKVCE